MCGATHRGFKSHPLRVTDHPRVYDRIGTAYARVRRPDPRIAARIDRALGAARVVLDVGCGAGSYESTGRRYVGVDPSRVMLAQRPRGADPAVAGAAERLPFRDATFDAAMAILTVHHWGDPAAGLAEVRRVTRGPIVVLTWESDRLARFWLVEEYLPEAGELDRALVTAADIAGWLGPCRVEAVPVPADCTDGFLAAYWRRPEAYLRPDVRAGISGIALLPGDAVDRFVGQLDTDLSSGAWQRRHADLLAMEEFDHGYRLLVSSPPTPEP